MAVGVLHQSAGDFGEWKFDFQKPLFVRNGAISVVRVGGFHVGCCTAL